jgi:hypothetical protein
MDFHWKYKTTIRDTNIKPYNAARMYKYILRDFHEFLLNLTLTCSGVQASKFTDFTFEMCTPKFLWIPAQVIHTNIPRFQEAHLGPKGIKIVNGDQEILIFSNSNLTRTHTSTHRPFARQSAQYLFWSSRSNSMSILVCLSCCFLFFSLSVLVDIVVWFRVKSCKISKRNRPKSSGLFGVRSHTGSDDREGKRWACWEKLGSDYKFKMALWTLISNE